MKGLMIAALSRSNEVSQQVGQDARQK